MTEKQKAKELVDEFSQYSDYENGKFCALICVEEILKEYTELRDDLGFNIDENGELEGYWEEIKQEIKKL